MAWQDYMTTCEYRHSRVRVFVKPRGGLESRYNLQLIYGIRACVEGPRFDLDLRDSISAQVDETVPVYSILNTSIHCRTSTSSPRSTRTPRLRGEGGARCFHHRQALPAGGESEWEDQEPQHRGHLNILRWLLFSPSRLQHSDPPRLRVTDIANPLPQSVVRIRPQNLQCRSITALSRGALHPRPSP